jgi:hypothetical protein
MLRSLRHLFGRLRIFISAIRSGLYGFILVWAGWLFFAPPSATEIDRLSLPPQATAQDDVVRTHRMAKLVALVATDRIYGIVADRAKVPMSAEQIKQGVILAAEGASLDEGAPGRQNERVLGIDAIQKNLARPGGAKFVTARTTP